MNLNPTVNYFTQTGIGLTQPPLAFYSYPIELPHSINITLANTNLNTNYIVHDSVEPKTSIKPSFAENNASDNEKKGRKKSKDYGHLQEELKKERQKNQILILKVIELEKLLGQKSERDYQGNLEFSFKGKKGPSIPQPMEKDRDLAKSLGDGIQEKTNKAIEENEENDKNLFYAKNLEIRMESLVFENEKLSKFLHEQASLMEKQLVSLEKKYNEQIKTIEILLSENEKLRRYLDDLQQKSQNKIKGLEEILAKKDEQSFRLEKENSIIVSSMAITSERQQIEKSKLASLIEQNSYLEQKNRILQAEIQRLKGDP